MIERGKKLGDIKSKSVCREVFHLSHMNEIGKSDSSIWSEFKLESTKLALMNEVVRHHMELKSITNDFFNKFTHSVKKNNGSKHFGRIVWHFVRLWYYYGSWNLKCKGQKPKSKHEFTMLTKFFKHVLSLRICLRWLHKSLSGLGAEELLHLAIVMMNSSSENWF